MLTLLVGCSSEPAKSDANNLGAAPALPMDATGGVPSMPVPNPVVTMGTGGMPVTGGSGATGGSASTGTGGTPVVVPDAGAADTGAPDAAVDGKDWATAGYLICEDFEATAVAGIPQGWTMHGNAGVADDQAAHGTHALKISAANNGERRIYTDAAVLGSGHWGRIYYKVQLPVPTVFVHSTLVALQGIGPTQGNEEVRVVDTVKNAQGKHQFLYNVQPAGAEFATGSAYDWAFDDVWHCAEWHIDNPTQSYAFYIDRMQVDSITKNNGAGNYNGTDIPPIFSQVKVGWNNYQSAAPGFVAWIDDVAMDEGRIGCLP